MTGNIGQDFMAVGWEKPAGGNEQLPAGAVSQWLCRVCGGGFTDAGSADDRAS
jgi:hypothetical protein